MRLAIQLARRGLGKTSPNPMVGAVLVKNRKIIGQGYHRKAGGPHAEIYVLRKQNAKGSTLYVTLEPCSTVGKTPPCTDEIIRAGVRRVVVASRDPNPKHNGRGIRILRRAGVRVDIGLLKDEATQLNEGFNKWIQSGMPFVIAKVGLSLDGKIATHEGDSKWITNLQQRRKAHQLRSSVDAILVGSRTVQIDNPQLTVRLAKRTQQPFRVVVDSKGKSALQSTIFHDEHRARTIVATSQGAPRQWRNTLVQLGVRVLLVPSHNLRAVMLALGQLQITSVLMEGGGGLLGAAFDEQLVDKAVFFYAPIILGGDSARSAVGGRGVSKVREAFRINSTSSFCVEGYVTSPAVRWEKEQ